MLAISKDSGFEGIGVYGLEGWMAENRLPFILDLIEDYSFNAIISLIGWNQTGFSYNQTQVSLF